MAKKRQDFQKIHQIARQTFGYERNGTKKSRNTCGLSSLQLVS
jgi:hypothetical protein